MAFSNQVVKIVEAFGSMVMNINKRMPGVMRRRGRVSEQPSMNIASPPIPVSPAEGIKRAVQTSVQGKVELLWKASEGENRI